VDEEGGLSGLRRYRRGGVRGENVSEDRGRWGSAGDKGERRFEPAAAGREISTLTEAFGV